MRIFVHSVPFTYPTLFKAAVEGTIKHPGQTSPELPEIEVADWIYKQVMKSTYMFEIVGREEIKQRVALLMQQRVKNLEQERLHKAHGNWKR